MIEAYPLHWPRGWKRTQFPHRSQFGTSFGKAREHLMYEIRLLGGSDVVISSNIPLKRDGFPYASFPEPNDPGVAVYFRLDGKNQCFPCDRWDRAVDNLHAIELTIEALRGLERWGAKDMIAAAFRGFESLPEHTHDDTLHPEKTKIDHFAGCTTLDEIKQRRRNLSKDLHPDKKGGDETEFIEMMRQYDEKIKEMSP